MLIPKNRSGIDGTALPFDLENHLSGDYLQDLTFIGYSMMRVMTERIDAMRMAFCEAGNFPEFQQVVAENPRQHAALYYLDLKTVRDRMEELLRFTALWEHIQEQRSEGKLSS